MASFNPMAGFKIDPWSGAGASAFQGSDNPMIDFGLGAPMAAPGQTPGGPGFFSMDSFLGGKNANGTATNGWGGMALGALQGLSSAFMGMKQYGLAKDQLAFSKDSFNKNYAAQRQTTNTRMEDRQRARVASNPGAYQSVGDYMSANGIA